LVINGVLKLNGRRIKDMIVKQKGSLHLEMQQRAIEFNSIVERHKRIRWLMTSLGCIFLIYLLV